MSEHPESISVLMEKNRLESLTDGIFAFAMTLLVTSMILPRGSLATMTSSAALVSMLPDFYHYIIGFFVLAAFWMGHHEQLRKIHHLDSVFMGLNIFGLFLVTMVPFSTAFIGDYSASDTVATCTFEFNLLLLGLVFVIQWWYATRNRYLVSPELSGLDIKKRMCHAMIIPVISLIGMLLAIAGFGSSTMIYMLSPFLSYGVEKILEKL